jgi:FkbM family methyltransferase
MTSSRAARPGVSERVGPAIGAALTGVILRLVPRTAVRLFGRMEARRPQSALVLLNGLLRPGDVAVDVGAHRGVFMDRMARIVGPTGHVHAFEPNPDSWRILSAVKGGSSNISLHHTGVSDRAGSATLYRPRTKGARIDAMSSLSKHVDDASFAYDPVEVGLEPLDAALAAEPRRIALLKVDVEGHELAVFKGAEEVLSRSRPAILVEIEQRHQASDIRETFAHLESRGYSGWFVGTSGLQPLAEFDLARHQLDLLGDGFAVGRPAPGYVSDFLFLPHGWTAGASPQDAADAPGATLI